MGVWLFILWFIISNVDGWALIGSWAAIGMNTVQEEICLFVYLFACLFNMVGP